MATPFGERRIDALRPGDVVYSVDHDAFVAVPIVRVSRSPVSGHHVVRIALDNGRFVEMSPGHPLPGGRTFGDLTAGATLGSARVLGTEIIPYPHPYTYDIEPDSDSGTYVAAGALVGSTLHKLREQR